MAQQFDTDSAGNVILKPVTGYTTAPVAGVAVLLQVQFVNSDSELQAGASQRLQFVMTPQIAQEIGDSLRRQAARLLAPSDPKATRQ